MQKYPQKSRLIQRIAAIWRTFNKTETLHYPSEQHHSEEHTQVKKLSLKVHPNRRTPQTHPRACLYRLVLVHAIGRKPATVPAGVGISYTGR
ncbi:hypothetical protein AVEN_98051-1 [Araneus ventricosus]|uniref:Uncharacterized protein n=1 Tax=Araneus ventricosus TaxID=182803 RepID=A0A4Y2P3U5_ARAVE|nr:hypothetical protein AVEN_98051-1 [Araneus ventricosus]